MFLKSINNVEKLCMGLQCSLGLNLICMLYSYSHNSTLQQKTQKWAKFQDFHRKLTITHTNFYRESLKKNNVYVYIVKKYMLEKNL